MPKPLSQKKTKLTEHAFSKELRVNIKKDHKLGFRRPPKSHIGGGNSLATIQINRLTNDEFDTLRRKIGYFLGPEYLGEDTDRRFNLRHDTLKPLTEIMDPELAKELMLFEPDRDKIRRLSRTVIPETVEQIMEAAGKTRKKI
jgi:hypothetical protein